jgi:hypothetical protein
MNPSLSADIITAAPFVWSLAVCASIRQGVWAQFFQLLQQATHVQACFCHLAFLEVRLVATRQCMLTAP